MGNQVSDFANVTYFIPQSRAQIEERYGKILTLDEHMVWPNANEWMKPCVLQPEITAKLVCTISKQPVEHIFSNIDIHKPLLDAFQEILDRNLHGELKTFDGCYNLRYVRGRDGIMSLHSWGIAIDLNAADNPLGGDSSWSNEFVDAWEKIGWSWGGRFHRPDPQHFQWAGSF